MHMKKILLLAAALILTVSCAQKKAPKALVLYYSQTSTTQAVAEEIANRLGADIEAIVPVVPYDGDYQATIERGRKEIEEGAFPEINPVKADIASYDVIFLGYPIWFGTYAPPVAAFLNTVDLTGKKVVPFCTFGSGGLDSSVKDIHEKYPGIDLLPGYGVRAARKDAVPAEVGRFLTAGGFLEGDAEKPADFSPAHPVSETESSIFDVAVDGYPMIHAKATEVSSRPVQGGTEYLFTAKDEPMNPAMEMPERFIKVYVLAEEGQVPVFTQVVR